jgi:hypothetical protein
VASINAGEKNFKKNFCQLSVFGYSLFVFDKGRIKNDAAFWFK